MFFMTETHLAPKAQALIQSISRSVIGKNHIIELVVTALISGGHILVEDRPGTGKTLLGRALSRAFTSSFKRVQFTADLMPSDITGTLIFNPNQGKFEFLPGPIFANVVLADEINRATPRAQSSLLEVMEEGQVTIDGNPHVMKSPFFVLATQNPLDFHGTFPLPESQLDRFALSFVMGYPTQHEERQILGLHQKNSRDNQTTSLEYQLESVANTDDINQLIKQVLDVEVSDELEDYIIRLVQLTRQHPEIVLGASTRAAVSLLRTSQAYALINNRNYVIPDDIKYLAPHAFAHRLTTRHGESLSERLKLVKKLVEQLAVKTN